MSNHNTVLHGVDGQKLSEWKELSEVECPDCGNIWIPITADGCKAVECQQCGAFINLHDSPDMTVDILKEWTRKEERDLRASLGFSDSRSYMKAMSVTFLITAPVHFFYQMRGENTSVSDFMMGLPVTSEDFAVPVSQSEIDNVNDHLNDEGSIVVGHLPMGLYMTSAVTMTYDVLADILRKYLHNKDYEWHVFVEAVYEKLELISIVGPSRTAAEVA